MQLAQVLLATCAGLSAALPQLASPNAVVVAAAAPPSSNPAPAPPAAPSQAPGPAPPMPSPAGLTPAMIEQIAPSTHSCASDPTYGAECRNSTVAAPAIAASFQKYGIQHPSVQAALLSLIIFESGSFKYASKHFPPTPGQGTRNMQSPKYNQQYAASLNKSVDDVVKGDDDNDSFGSAAWFVTTQCPFSVRQAMWGGSESGWENYLTQCVGTTVTDDRKAPWQKALQVLGNA